jgi:hypothetical protein
MYHVRRQMTGKAYKEGSSMSNNDSYNNRETGSVVIREAVAADEDALRRLAERDSARPIQGPAIVAEVGGELRAALSATGGGAIADPFRPTAELVELLSVRARAQSNGWRTTGLRRAAAASSSRRTGVVYGAFSRI